MNGCLILCLLVAALSPGDVEQEVQYAALLRERGLFRLAELQCQQLLARSDLDATAASQATIELSKSLAAHALNSRPPEREQLWQSATAVIDEALVDSPEHASRMLLQTQKGLTMLLQAEWSRRVAEVQARDDSDWKLARGQLREAISQLEAVARELLRPRSRANKADDALSPAQRESLRRNVDYQLARAYRNHALTYADRSPDRVDALTRALDKLQPLANSNEVDQLAWQSSLDLISIRRMLKDFEKARRLIAELQVDRLPAVFTGLLAAESVRLALAQANPDQAAAMANNFAARSKDQVKSHPEFELARIETLVARAQQADEKQQVESSRRLIEQATGLATSLGDRHGTYWTLRGEMLIARLAKRSQGNGDLDLLTTAARSYLQRDLPDDAAEMFIQAARRAEQDGDAAKAFQFRYRAAAVDHQSGNLQPAIDRLRDAALKYPTQPEAASAHLLGAFDAAALYQREIASGTGPQMPARALAQYRKLLEEHLAHWPDAATADQARLWLGRLQEAQGNWEDALDNYQAIEPTSPHSVPRYERLSVVFDKILANPDTESPAKVGEARRWFDAQAQSAISAGKSRPAVRADLEAARLRLFHEPTDYTGADANLREALTLIDRESPQVRELRAMAVVAAAGQNQMPRARIEFSQTVPLPARTLADMLRGLQMVVDTRPDDGELLDMMAQTADLLTTYRDQLTETDRRLLAETEADSQQRSHPENATQIYTQLAEAHPQNARIQRRLAELLSLGIDRPAREAALTQWRLVVRKSRPYTQGWFRAKLGVATAHFNLNDRKRAQEIIELLMNLHPEMGGPELKRDFMSLLGRCRR